MEGGILYAPSASVYAYTRHRIREDSWRSALIIVGDEEDDSLFREAQKIAQCLPCQSRVVTTHRELARHSETADLLYITSHGTAPRSAADQQGWSLLFDNGILTAEDFYRGRVRLNRGALVVLSACSVGKVLPGPVHELNGLVHALFFAGAGGILAARWPILYEAAEAVFVGTIRKMRDNTFSLSIALQEAIRNAMEMESIKSYLASPEADMFFRGPFLLLGGGG